MGNVPNVTWKMKSICASYWVLFNINFQGFQRVNLVRQEKPHVANLRLDRWFVNLNLDIFCCLLLVSGALLAAERPVWSKTKLFPAPEHGLKVLWERFLTAIYSSGYHSFRKACQNPDTRQTYYRFSGMSIFWETFKLSQGNSGWIF